jgi:hypothetical protein
LVYGRSASTLGLAEDRTSRVHLQLLSREAFRVHASPAPTTQAPQLPPIAHLNRQAPYAPSAVVDSAVGHA